MKNLLQIGMASAVALSTILLFQNCDGGFKSADNTGSSSHSSGEFLLELPTGETVDLGLGFNGTSSDFEASAVAFEDLVEEDLAAVQRGSESLKLERLYVGAQHVVYTGKCDSRFGGLVMLDLEVPGYSNIGRREDAPVGYCFTPPSDTGDLVSPDIFIGFGNTTKPLNSSEMVSVGRVYYEKDSGMIPMDHLESERELHAHIRSNPVSTVEDPDVDYAYSQSRLGGNGFNVFNFETAYKRLKPSITSPTPNETVPVDVVVEGTCFDDQEVLVQPGNRSVRCSGGRFSKTLNFSSRPDGDIEIQARVPADYDNQFYKSGLFRSRLTVNKRNSYRPSNLPTPVPPPAEPEPTAHPESYISSPRANDEIFESARVEGTCFNTQEILIRPGEVTVPCSDGRFSAEVSFANQGSGAFELFAQAPSAYSYPADQIGASVWVEKMPAPSSVAGCDISPTDAEMTAVRDVFDDYFDRQPDDGGLCHWSKAFRRHRNTTTLEYQILMGISGQRDIDMIQQDPVKRARVIDLTVERADRIPPRLAENLSASERTVVNIFKKWFDRHPKSAGLFFWAGHVGRPGVNPAQFERSVLNGAGAQDQQHIKGNPSNAQRLRDFCTQHQLTLPDWF